MTALQAELEESDGVVVLNSRVSNVNPFEDGIEFQVGDERFECVTLINSAGLGAVELMSDALCLADNAPTMHLAKGHYFSYQGKSPFGHLIYPLPSGGGLLG
jgi:L-2-hydroxyglutarate oxidase LhgO